MTDDKKAEIQARARTDAYVMGKHNMPVHNPYATAPEATLWKTEFDRVLAELRGKT